jgi:hypothetical protein
VAWVNATAVVFSLMAFSEVATAQSAASEVYERMRAYEALAGEYQQFAVDRDTTHAGTMYNNGFRYSESLCGILGELLGLSAFTSHLYEVQLLPLDESTEPHDALVFSIYLGSWVGAARRSLEQTDSQRISTWNLDCRGMFGIPFSVGLPNTSPEAEFSLQEEPLEGYGDTLLVYGDIEFGFFERFVQELNRHDDLAWVSLGSAGGSVRDAMLAGLEIRRRGIGTRIHGNCMSACPIVYLGGQEREMWPSTYRLGFHQVANERGEAIPFDDPTYQVLISYAQQMGADGSTIVAWMQSASPDDMYIPDPRDWCAPRVATYVQRIC